MSFQDEFDNALKRLLLIPSLDHTGRNYRIQSTISFEKALIMNAKGIIQRIPASQM